MDENRFWILASKKIAADITPEELAELDLLFIQHPEFRDLFELFSVKSNRDYNLLSNKEEEHALKILRSKIVDPTKVSAPIVAQGAQSVTEADDATDTGKGKRWKSFLVIAAGLCFIALYISKYKEQAPVKPIAFENKIATRPGSRSQVKLPDGTLVILNADSKLSYPDNFVGETREVTLEGEAFFEVTENKARPFIIHSKSMDIKVLGTVFNVKAYPSESTSEASLIRGSIEVTLKERRNEKIMLKPNEKISVSNVQEEPQIPVSDAAKGRPARPNENEQLISLAHLSIDQKENIIKEIGWTQNKLMFKNESLASIAVILERWYGQEISIKSPQLKERMFTGNFQNENLLQVLEAFQASSGFTIKTENNKLILY